MTFDAAEGEAGRSVEVTFIAFTIGFLIGVGFPVLPVTGYVRISPEDVLRSRVRRLLSDFIRERPGSSFSQIRKALGLENGGAAYHLDVLEDLGLVHSESRRRRRWYYANGNATLWEDLPRSPLQVSLLDQVRRAPGIAVRELARALGRSASSVAYNVKCLEQDGHLRTEQSGIRIRCFPMEAGGYSSPAHEGDG